jgi:hypothetical protein
MDADEKAFWFKINLPGTLQISQNLIQIRNFTLGGFVEISKCAIF